MTINKLRGVIRGGVSMPVREKDNRNDYIMDNLLNLISDLELRLDLQTDEIEKLKERLDNCKCGECNDQ